MTEVLEAQPMPAHQPYVTTIEFPRSVVDSIVRAAQKHQLQTDDLGFPDSEYVNHVDIAYTENGFPAAIRVMRIHQPTADAEFGEEEE